MCSRASDARKYDFDKDETIVAAIHELEKKYEGSWPGAGAGQRHGAHVRIMIEGPDQYEMDQDVFSMAQLIEKQLNG